MRPSRDFDSARARPSRPTPRPALLAALLLAGACSGARDAGEAPAVAPDLPSAAESVASWTFEDEPTGTLPAGWTAAETRPAGTPGTWELRAPGADRAAHDGANVLALTRSANAGQTFNLAVAGGFRATDLELAVSVRAVGGAEDQGGGPVWRYVDPDRYYVCRFNPLEDNFRLYKVVGGVRTQLASSGATTVPGRWYDVRVVMAGDEIRCWLDGELLLETRDASIPEGGRVGCWTKADATTEFDSLTARGS